MLLISFGVGLDQPLRRVARALDCQYSSNPRRWPRRQQGKGSVAMVGGVCLVTIICRRVPDHNLKEGLSMIYFVPPTRAPHQLCRRCSRTVDVVNNSRVVEADN